MEYAWQCIGEKASEKSWSTKAIRWWEVAAMWFFVEHVWIDVVVSGYSAWCKVDIAVVCVRRSIRRRIVRIGLAVPSTLVRKCAG